MYFQTWGFFLIWLFISTRGIIENFKPEINFRKYFQYEETQTHRYEKY